MIHVVTALNRRPYARAIEDHHVIRHRIFVEERGWRALARPDGREIDAFDTADTIYMLAMDGERVIGGHRLFPTLQPHMISEVFPHLVTRGPVPRDVAIYEWSRFFVVKEYRSSKVYFELLAAVQEFCLNVGIASITAVIEMWWLPRFHEAGFVVHPLGLPQPVENVPTLAIQIDIRRDSLDRARALANFAPVTTSSGARDLPLMTAASTRNAQFPRTPKPHADARLETGGSAPN